MLLTNECEIDTGYVGHCIPLRQGCCDLHIWKCHVKFTLYTGYRFQEFTCSSLYAKDKVKKEYKKAAGYILATFSKVKFCVDADKMALQLLYYLSCCTTLIIVLLELLHYCWIIALLLNYCTTDELLYYWVLNYYNSADVRCGIVLLRTFKLLKRGGICCVFSRIMCCSCYSTTPPDGALT